MLSAVKSVLDQSLRPGEVVVNWPRRSLRTKSEYPLPPAMPDGVVVNRCDDVGPATKLLPTMARANDRALIVVDDDVVYPYEFVETLMAASHSMPDAAIGLRGWRIDANRNPRSYQHTYCTAITRPEPVDILLGTWGYLLPPGALDDAVHDFSGWPDAVRWVDDVWISGHLAKRGVARYVVPLRGLPIETRASRTAALTDGPNASGVNDQIAVDAFAQWW